LASEVNSWMTEAVGWASIYEDVVEKNQATDRVDRANNLLRFSEFTKACTFPKVIPKEKKEKHMIYFSDSSRTRKVIIGYVFMPLITDVFSYNLTASIFDCLGILHDNSYVTRCFGEWIMVLPLQQICQKGILAEKSPLIRFAQDAVRKQLENDKIDDDEIILAEIHDICSRSDDLVRALSLAVICREAVEKVTARKERATYGKILSGRAVNVWEVLIRKLRVCLLVFFRLKDVHLPAPITVQHLGEEGVFSMYELLAHDQIVISHVHEEIVSLENACRVSSYAIDLFTAEADAPSKIKQIQNSCRAASMGEDARAEYLIDYHDEEKYGALILFLHCYNEPRLLVAHRVRLLVAEWNRNPSDLCILRDALVALASLCKDPEVQQLALAVCLDLWHSSIRPLYRARLNGFGGLHELNEAMTAPLLDDCQWFIELGRASLQVIDFIRKIPPRQKDDKDVLKSIADLAKVQSETWPSVRVDHILKRLVEKSSKMNEGALDSHCAVICSLIASTDVVSLGVCIPSIHELFLPHSLYANPAVDTPEARMSQASFIKDAVISKARQIHQETIDSFDLGEIETLCSLWSIALVDAYTTFLLVMYEVGKDAMVDDLGTKCSNHVDVRRFVDGGVDIVCQRLNAFLSSAKMQSEHMRQTMGMLDADLCEWIHQRARQAQQLSSVLQLDVSLSKTNLFALRLLSLSASSNIDTALRVKIHSLVVLSGTLVKVVEQKTQYA
jgi:hypothetical protein